MDRTCEEIMARANEPGALDEGDRRHVEGCASCRESLRVVNALQATRRDPSPLALVRLRERLDRRAPTPLRRPWFAPALAGGLAAAAAAAVLWGLPVRHPAPTRDPSASGVATAAYADAEESWLTMTDADWTAEVQYDGASAVVSLMDFTQ